jgi:hypothetical protein
LHHPKLTLIKTAIHFVTKLTSCTNWMLNGFIIFL